ncbi:hypothetical protein TNCV_2282601 [Trichonephila clavipes]|nr:hypothetical protein TNCV_2282601 [Trichonephila clavipes]
MTSETVEVARIALRLPPFWKSNVRLWIAQCDHAFTFSEVSPGMILSILLWLRTWMLKLSPACRTLDEKPSHLLRKMKELANGQLQMTFCKVCGFKECHHISRLFCLHLQSLWINWLSSLIRFLRLLVHPQLSVSAQLFLHHPSHLHAVFSQPWTPLARQIQELSLQVAELTRERNSSRHQRYSSDRRRSHSRSRSVNRGSGICYHHRRYKNRPASVFHPAFVQKKRVSSVIAGMAEPSKHTSRLFLLDRKSGQKFLIDSGSEICVIPPSQL